MYLRADYEDIVAQSSSNVNKGYYFKKMRGEIFKNVMR